MYISLILPVKIPWDHKLIASFIFVQYWFPNCIKLLFCIFLENNCKIVTEERGLHDICSAMQYHDTNVDLIESACSAVWSLSMEGKINCELVKF